jgi:succinate dehydrogenase/fumarate reductase-like Fe-S protein
MLKKLEISLFRFNYKTDYLPYYKQYKFKYQENQTLLDVLKSIDEKENVNFKTDGLLSINGFFFANDTQLEDILPLCGLDWKIEPISSYRAKHDLVINDEDFYTKLNFFDEYLSDEDREKFSSNQYKLVYYASHTLNVNRDYIGDHNLLIATELIERDPSLKEDIIQLLLDDERGIWYHTHLNNRFINAEAIESKIQKLFALCEVEYTSQPQLSSLNIEINPNFNKNVAIYGTSNYQALAPALESVGIKPIKLTSQNNDVALQSSKVDANFSLRIAGEILLEAKDNNAQMLVVSTQEELSLFDGMQKRIERVVGRDIQLPVVTYDEFVIIAQGRRVASLSNHKISVVAA